MKTKKTDSAGFSWIAAGLVFLFNPCFHIIDVLPDFFGLLLILRGLDRLRDISPHLARARVGIVRATWTELVKLLLVFISGQMDGYMLVVLSSAAGLLECIFLIPAMNELFSGTDELRLRLVDRCAGSTPDECGTLSSLFIVARAALAVVPELTQFIEDSYRYGDVTSGKQHIDVGSLTVFLGLICCALVLALGIAWLSSAEKYISQLRRDTEFCRAVNGKYEREVLSDSALMTRRRVAGFSVLYVVSLIFLFCLQFDSHYPVPEFLFGAFALAAVFSAGGFADAAKRKKAVLLCSAQMIISAAAFCLLWIYGDRFGGILSPYEGKGFALIFTAYCAAMIASLSLDLAVLRLMCGIQYEMTDSVVGWGIESERRLEIDEARKREIGKKIKTSFVIGVCYCVISVICMAVIPLEDTSDFIALSWAIRSIACAVLMISVYNCSAEIRSEAEK